MIAWPIVNRERIQKEQEEAPHRTSATFLMGIVVFFAWPIFVFRAVAGGSGGRAQASDKAERRSQSAHSASVASRGATTTPLRGSDATPQMRRSRERSRRRVALPPDILPKLESYGRVAKRAGRAGGEDYGLLEVELWQLAQADRDGLIEAVADVARPAGGWATYGASRAIWSVVSPDVEGLEHPAYRELLTDGLEFLRDSGFDPVWLATHERDHWMKTKGPGMW